MPYKKSYTKGNVKKGASKTPSNVMGSQGHSAKMKYGHSIMKKLGKKQFPQK